ncbi:hypothetical protein LNO36_10860 [Klebsiella variicola subsp. variicola]|nr:hypothetical protein [Klebsiella variicola subsp. variicola]
MKVLLTLRARLTKKKKTDEVVHQTDAVDIEPGPHNKDEDQPIDYVHVMVDLETMGKNITPLSSLLVRLFLTRQPALLEKVSIKSYALNPL